MKETRFSSLNISKELIKSISDSRLEYLTPIQAKAIPEILAGFDVLGLAATGTGKTLAFVIPTLEKLDFTSNVLQALILCPTRELAVQVSEEIKKIIRPIKKAGVLAVYGGQPIERQIFGLRRKPQILVGTPGRTLDHLRRGSFSLRDLKMFILDEADEMLNMGFRRDVETILEVVPEERQMILFSATMSKTVLEITKKYQKKAKIVKVESSQKDLSKIEQSYVMTDSSKKLDILMQLINLNDPNCAIVFCNTKRKVDKVARILSYRGFSTEGIHGDIRQAKRDRIMSRFKKNKIKILVATDVAARGIDVDNVEIVFNYEIPKDVDSYVHRIGRTGRAGKFGKAISLVSRLENSRIAQIKRVIKSEIVKQSCNTAKRKEPDSVNKTERANLELRSKEIIRQIKRKIYKEELGQYLNLVKNVSDKKSNNGHEIAAALLKMVVEKDQGKFQ